LQFFGFFILHQKQRGKLGAHDLGGGVDDHAEKFVNFHGRGFKLGGYLADGLNICLIVY